ncbi:efflux RND transporter permease subunit [Methylobacillus gramineus]|uniref:efflux RND transporter permease subunit n=1 Tax=Methylobacillus gramineus TaxID=755169 RepID=UPI001CFF5CFD|nr:efflux RND transporter permease subunit [Methylobacillus gramineus]MCB5183601.1 efflux RND transporter permease subunit [Methylobacillus gramineus]
MWIVNIALRRPYTFIVAALLIVLSTPYVLRNMPTDIFPDINIPVIAISWSYNGLSAREIADRITNPTLRGLNQTVEDVEHTESVSLAGLSISKIFFQQGTDIRSAMTQVLSNVTTAQRSMPQGMQPAQVVQYSATDLPLIQLGLSSDTVSDIEIGDAVNNSLRPSLLKIKGVTMTFPYGNRGRQVAVNLNNAALIAKGLTPADVSSAIASQTLILPTGTIKLGESQYDVSLNGAISSIPKLGDIPIRTINGNTIYVRDVAQVRDGSTPATNIVRQNGERGILVSVLKTGGASSLEVVNNVKAALPKAMEALEGIKLKAMFDQSLFVKAAISNVVFEALIAAALTAALILLFLGSWQTTAIIAVSIPLSIMSSLIVLHLIGETINLMTLGGLALAIGILVDDATVEIENVERHMHMGKPPHQAILDGAAEIAVPAFVSTLCICIVFAPMFFLEGITRYLFVPMAEAVIFAMLASYIISRTLVPTLVMFMMTANRTGKPSGNLWLFQGLHHKFNQGFETFRRYYISLLGALLNRRRHFSLLFILFSLLSLGIYPLLGQDLFPEVDAGQIRLHIRAASGTRLEEMPKLVEKIEHHIKSVIPATEIGNVLDIVGGPYSPRNTLFGNAGTVESSDSEIMLSLINYKNKPTADYIAELRKQLPRAFPGVEFFFQPADQVSQTLNFGIPAPIDILFKGNKIEENTALANSFSNKLREIPGVVDAHVHQRWSKPVLRLEMDRARLHQQGLTATDVAQNLMISLSGSMQTAPLYWLNPTNGNTYNIGVNSLESDLSSIDALLRTPVKSSNSEPQLLGNLVKISRSAQQPVVSHYDVNQVVNVYASVQGRDLGSASRAIQKLVDETREQLPKGSEIEIRGQSLTLDNAFIGLGTGLIVAIVLVYLLIVVNFQSWLDAAIIITALPAALAGIAWTLFLSGTTLSVPALTGMIMSIGVVTANSILVISFARTQLALGVPPITAALDAGATRLRPVLMTASAMIVGMLPMALGLGEGGEQNAPLGRAVIGGLLFATVSTLLFVPVVFASLHRRRQSTRHPHFNQTQPEPTTP